MKCDSPFWVLPKAAFEKVPVPCGRCPPCKMRRVNSWVFRLMQEEKISSSSYFITLTYDTRHVPISDNGFMTLRKADFQKFMKRLRKLEPDSNLRYYSVGEYGDKNKRPHYHVILFNLRKLDNLATAWSINGSQLGGIDVGTCTGDSVAYTMKYIDKASAKKQHARDDREPEFPLMSKGLGNNFLTESMVSYYKADVSRLSITKESGHKIALPKYYRDKIYSDDEKRAQRFLIDSVMSEQEKKDVREWSEIYAGSDYTYEQWKESRRYGRHKQFYSRQKSRTL